MVRSSSRALPRASVARSRVGQTPAVGDDDQLGKLVGEHGDREGEGSDDGTGDEDGEDDEPEADVLADDVVGAAPDAHRVGEFW